MTEKKAFIKLYHLDVTSKVETKNTGKTSLSYLSWAWAWAEVKKEYPEATYEIKKFDNGNGRLVPYMYDEALGIMCFTEVTIEDITHEMWLPVMDGANKAMKFETYEYQTKFGAKTVQPATMFDVNKTIMRCLVKNLAMHGLGLHIYAGEDLPELDEEEVKKKADATTKANIEKLISRAKSIGYPLKEKEFDGKTYQEISDIVVSWKNAQDAKGANK